jgi:pimeloyl-ACP methyl ester carboxylesterase
MPIASVRGAQINYEVLGDSGPWVSLTPGGRRDKDGVRYLAENIAAQGFRVLLHDRRNCGASDVVLVHDDPEYVVWADDLKELLEQLGATPCLVGGTSAGCRLALLTYLRHPESVRGLLLWRVTGGRFAAERLAQQYYGQYIDAAKAGGMQAVAESEHFAERIAANPANRDAILKTNPRRFIEAFESWRQGFLADADLPVIGATEDALRGIDVPTSIVPGNDLTHPRAVGENAARLIPGAECHVLLQSERDLDVSPPEDLEAVADEHARVYVDFMRRHSAVTAG